MSRLVTVPEWQIKWWRRGESNPGPKVLHISLYMRSQFFSVSVPGASTDKLSRIPITLSLAEGRGAQPSASLLDCRRLPDTGDPKGAGCF